MTKNEVVNCVLLTNDVELQENPPWTVKQNSAPDRKPVPLMVMLTICPGEAAVGAIEAIVGT